MHQRMGRQEGSESAPIRMILLSMNAQNQEQFIQKMTCCYEPDIQIKLYEFAKAMICSWAGKGDLRFEDAVVIEDCRKICDIMGWPPSKW